MVVATFPHLGTPHKTGRSVVVLDALRTPFVKSFGLFENETPLALSLHTVRSLLNRSNVDAAEVGGVVWGAVVPQVRNPNVARDLVLFSGLPKHTPGYTLNMACASSLQAALSAHDAIALGRHELMVAGGVEVLSDVPITYSDKAQKFLTRFGRARSLPQRLSLLATISPKDFLPKAPSLAEPYTGLTMGDHGEIMAVKNTISRARQDEYAMLSHTRAHAAIQAGYLADEVVPTWVGRKSETCVTHDNIVRGDTTTEALAALRPAFDKKHGTLTAGNSSALTDGASAVLLAHEDYAKHMGLAPLGRILGAHSVAIDPKDQLLIGPAIAIPQLLKRHGLGLDDIDIFELHEAFAAQVLSCLDAMNNATFCRDKAGLSEAFGNIPLDKVNVDGSSLAYGHPFGATGGRLISRALRILQRTGKQRAVIGICAAGGMAQAMLLERM